MKAISEKTQQIAVAVSSISAIIAFIAMVTNSFAFNETSTILNWISGIGGTILAISFLSVIFISFSGLSGYNTEITNSRLKIFIFWFCFPMMTFFSVAILESIFNFLPDYRDAMLRGDREAVYATTIQSAKMFWGVCISLYIVLMGGGRLFNKIWGHKIEG